MRPLSRRCRLFDLDPDLLPLFQYNCKRFASPQECLAAPEFLDHIRKVRGVGAIRGWGRECRASGRAHGKAALPRDGEGAVPRLPRRSSRTPRTGSNAAQPFGEPGGAALLGRSAACAAFVTP